MAAMHVCTLIGDKLLQNFWEAAAEIPGYDAFMSVFHFTVQTAREENYMRQITVSLAAAIFVLGSMALANAQTQGASSINAQAHNATTVHKAACYGWGRWCGPGTIRRCGPYRCWCAPCW